MLALEPPKNNEHASRMNDLTPTIRVRPYQPSDSPQVRELYMAAMANHYESPYARALRAQLVAPISLISYSLIVCGVIAHQTCPTTPFFISRSGISMVVIGVLMFSVHRVLLRSLFNTAFDQIMSGDLKAIESHYHLVIGTDSEGNETQNYVPSGKSGFWVAEIENWHDGQLAQIIGTVGLDSDSGNNPESAELRRMVVSPLHRRKGLALLLIKTLVAHARFHNVKNVFLSTSSVQKEAVEMYPKLGWKLEKKVDTFHWSQKMYVYHYNLEVNSCQL